MLLSIISSLIPSTKNTTERPLSKNFDMSIHSITLKNISIDGSYISIRASFVITLSNCFAKLGFPMPTKNINAAGCAIL